MRLKSYTGHSMAEVMGRVRDELGADTIILRSEDIGGGGKVRITVAYEGKPASVATPGKWGEPEIADPFGGAPTHTQTADSAELSRILNYHQADDEVIDVLTKAARAAGRDPVGEALTTALDTVFHFSPVGPANGCPVMLVGPPGSGKTVAVAKLAAAARLEGRAVRILSTDTVKASGVDQLEHFARLMHLEIGIAGSPDELSLAIRDFDDNEDACDILIDTPGINPFETEDLDLIRALADAADAEVVLVLPADIGAAQAADVAKAVRALGASRLIGTRLDAARRWGGLLAAAHATGLAFAAFGASPYVADLVERPDPAALATRLTDIPAETPAAPPVARQRIAQ